MIRVEIKLERNVYGKLQFCDLLAKDKTDVEFWHSKYNYLVCFFFKLAIRNNAGEAH